MCDFDTRRPPIKAETSFGHWTQTVDEVHIVVDVWRVAHVEAIDGKRVKCEIAPSRLKCVVDGSVVLQGALYGVIQPDDSTWTLAEKRYIEIVLSKCSPGADNIWRALFSPNGDGKSECYEADYLTLDKMQQFLTLQRFQIENPGMDFSTADITGNYTGGGPKLPEYGDS